MMIKPPPAWTRAIEQGTIELAPLPQLVNLGQELQLSDAIEVNELCNSGISYASDGPRDIWKAAILGGSGDCEDIAEAKRQMLIQRGWPAGALRLTGMITSSGQDHCVLSIIDSSDPLILDNRTDKVYRQSQLEAAGDRFISRELPGSMLWERLSGAPAPSLEDAMNGASLGLDWSRYPNFSAAEFACKCGCGQADMSPDFIGRLQRIRTELGKPIIISSGYRCPNHNAKVSSTGRDGPHTTGRAADLRCSHDVADRITDLAKAHGMTGRGFMQTGPAASRFIHLDNLPDAPGRPRPTIWTY